MADGDIDPLVERVMRYFIKKKKIQENFKKAFWEADKYILPLKTFSDVLLTEFLMFKALFTGVFYFESFVFIMKYIILS